MTTDDESTAPAPENVAADAVAADVPVGEPVAPAPVEPAAPLAEETPFPVETPAAEPEPVETPAETDASEPEAPAAPEPPEPAPPAPEPVEPVEPVAPVEPVEPVAPVAPEPVVPVAPAVPEPTAPTAPEPVVPAAPVPVPEPAAPPPPAEPVPPAPPVEPAPVVPPVEPAPVVPPVEPAPVVPSAPDPVDIPVTPELASAVPVPDDLAADPGEPPPARGRGPLLSWLPAVLLPLLLVAGAVAWFGPVADWREAAQRDERRDEALAQSRQLALSLGTVRHDRLDEDLRRIADNTTGEAHTEFSQKLIENEPYKKLVRDNQATMNSTIVRIGLVPCGTDESACHRGETATVIVFMDQSQTNKLIKTPRVDRNPFVLTLVRRGERWLISEVELL